jgi:hypothetical protein
MKTILSIKAMSTKADKRVLPVTIGPITSVTFLTAFRTPLPWYLLPPSRNSTAS